MARKKHAEEHVNLERWLISYADFITLLFATFVVLYALSQIDLAKFKDLKISLAKAFSAPPTILQGDAGMLDKNGNTAMDPSGQADNQNLIPPLLDKPYSQKENVDFNNALDKLSDKKAKELKDVKTQITERGLVIKLLGNVMFEPSTASIKKESYKTLDDVGNMIKTKFPNHLIRVEGHTDNMPMSSVMYPSNWELSSARSSAIIRYMIARFNMQPDRFSALGYADSIPIASNRTEEGRKANRRVEIVILRNNLLKTENLSQGFKKSLKEEIDQFKNIESVKKKKEDSPQTSDAVQNLLKESGNNSNVIIFNNSNDDYRKQAAKILQQLKEKEQQAEEDSRVRKQQFANSVKNQFEHSKK